MVLFVGRGFAQNTLADSLKIIPVDSLIYSSGNQAPKEVKLTNVKTYINLLSSNLQQIFAKPFHLTKKDWQNLGDFSFLMVGLSVLDQPIQQTALNYRKDNSTFNDASNFITRFGADYEIYTLVTIGAFGLIIKDEKLKNTTLLATQAFITAGSVATVLKILTGRDRPSYYGVDEVAEPRFRGPSANGNNNSFSSSFPSGHSSVAFAAATVFALEYKNKPVIPVIAYSAASLVSLSRITENKHWATDVAVGAALGYLSGKQAVNNYHRYINQQENEKRKTQYSFQLNYYGGHWEPGIIVHLP